MAFIYMSKCSVMTSMTIRYQHCERWNWTHSGKAKAIYKLIIPIDVATAKCLFAIISVDEDVPKEMRRNTEEDNSPGILTDRQLNPGKT